MCSHYDCFGDALYVGCRVAFVLYDVLASGLVVDFKDNQLVRVYRGGFLHDVPEEEVVRRG